jgi:malonyl CoA-acyl carrier protein transacylase
MICFMFSGQPMTLAHPALQDPDFAGLAACCRDVTGFDLLKPDSDHRQLTESVRLQLFGTAIGLFQVQKLITLHGVPQIVAEHSMGIYPALVACDSLERNAAFELTLRLGRCLAEFGAGHAYALGSIIGLNGERLAVIAANHGVYIANHNTSHHFLLAGEREHIEAAATEAEASGAFSVGVFPCDAPLHTTLLNPLVSALTGIVADYSFGEPKVPLLEHFNQTLLTLDRIPQFIVDELCQPVYWDDTYRALRQKGVTRFYESGAAQALTKFNRWIDSETVSGSLD